MPDKSVAITRFVDGESLRTDDVVVFHADWSGLDSRITNVVHRLSLVVPTADGLVGYTTGDANLIADPQPVNLQDDVSLVKAIVPFAGVLYGVPSTVIFFGAVGLLLVLVIYRPDHVKPMSQE